jgi:superfamily II DNA or RNA helicase
VETRQYQEKAIDAIIENYTAGIRHQLIVMATGTGKTVVFSKAYAQLIAKLADLQGRMLVLAHREELIDQAIKALQRVNPDVKVGKEMNVYRADEDCKIVVSCVASIGREGSARLARFGKTFDVVVCDEAHHSIAQTYLNVFNALGVFEPESKALLIGFTATPKRKNRTKEGEDELISLASVYKKIVYSYPMRKAIKDGWLVPVRGFRVKTTASLDHIKTVAGEYKQDELAVTVNTDDRNLRAVKAWHDYAENRQTVAFTVDISHAKDLASCFRASGVNAEPVWGDDPDRVNKLRKHRDRAIKLLSNCQVLTEGYDDWRLGCILMAAPTKSSSRYTQQIGRGTRLQDGTGNLKDALANGLVLEKKDCIIIDMVDNSRRCTAVTLPTLVGLDPEFDLHGDSLTDAAEKMEALQEKLPGVNLTALRDLNEEKDFVESIDIFRDPYSPQVKTMSSLSWMNTQDGGYTLVIPEKRDVREAGDYYKYVHERLHLSPNDLDQWDLALENKNETRVLGTYSDLQEGFEVADDIIKRCRADRMPLITRVSTWHNKPASTAAKSYLAKLIRKAGKQSVWCLCAASGNRGTTCPVCRKSRGVTAGQVSTAFNVVQQFK